MLRPIGFPLRPYMEIGSSPQDSSSGESDGRELRGGDSSPRKLIKGALQSIQDTLEGESQESEGLSDGEIDESAGRDVEVRQKILEALAQDVSVRVGIGAMKDEVSADEDSAEKQEVEGQSISSADAPRKIEARIMGQGFEIIGLATLIHVVRTVAYLREEGLVKEFGSRAKGRSYWDVLEEALWFLEEGRRGQIVLIGQEEETREGPQDAVEILKDVPIPPDVEETAEIVSPQGSGDVAEAIMEEGLSSPEDTSSETNGIWTPFGFVKFLDPEDIGAQLTALYQSSALLQQEQDGPKTSGQGYVLIKVHPHMTTRKDLAMQGRRSKVEGHSEGDTAFLIGLYFGLASSPSRLSIWFGPTKEIEKRFRGNNSFNDGLPRLDVFFDLTENSERIMRVPSSLFFAQSIFTPRARSRKLAGVATPEYDYEESLEYFVRFLSFLVETI